MSVILALRRTSRRGAIDHLTELALPRHRPRAHNADMRHVTCAILAALMIFASDVTAGVVLVSRESSISASGTTSDDSFDLQDALTTPGPFDSSVSDSIAVPAG